MIGVHCLRAGWVCRLAAGLARGVLIITFACKDPAGFAVMLFGAGSCGPAAGLASAVAPAGGRDSGLCRSVTAAPTTRTQTNAAPQRRTGTESQRRLSGASETALAISG